MTGTPSTPAQTATPDPGEDEAAASGDLDGAPPATADRGPGAVTRRRLADPGLRWVWLAGAVLIGLQLVGLLVWSAHLWSRFDETSDMGTFSQAWSQIATGHLNPYETTFPYNYPHYGYPFYQSHLELLMWPLALLYFVWPHAIDLLVVQDLAIAGAGLVGLRWALELLDAKRHTFSRLAWVLGAAVLAIIVLNPWTYWTATYDFHFQPIATFFVLLAGRDVWLGRRRAWIWVVCVLACGDVAATYVVALGLAAIVSGPRTRWRGLWLVGVGVVWLAVVAAVHSGKGTSLDISYGYLAHHPIGEGLGGLVAIGTGVLAHPSTPAHVLNQRREEIYKYLAGVGSFGLFSGIGFFAVLAVLFPTALNASATFIGADAAFQSFFVVMFLAVGTAQLLAWLSQGDRHAHRSRWSTGLAVLALALAAVALTQTIVESVHWTPKARQTLATIPASTASALSRAAALVPDRAEAVVSDGVMGRFGDRRWLYPYIDAAFPDGQTVPLFGHDVYFVLVPGAGVEVATPQQTQAAMAQLGALGARRLLSDDGVYVYLLHPKAGRRELHFPAS